MEVGIDCVDIARFDKDALSNKKFLKRIFTKDEIQYCNTKGKPSQHFAVRFAGKEAIVKALSQYNIKIPLNQIEIVNNREGIPFVRILNEKYKDLEIKISLSHSSEIAIAVAIVSKYSTFENSFEKQTGVSTHERRN